MSKPKIFKNAVKTQFRIEGELFRLTCSPVASSVSGWKVNNGCAWFSESQTAFSCRLTREYGRYCSRLPETSRTCRDTQLPNSAGSFVSLLSRKLRTPKFVRFPMSGGKATSALRSTFKLFNRVIRPSELGSSMRKFSVRISSCMFSHLQGICGQIRNISRKDGNLHANAFVERVQAVLVEFKYCQLRQSLDTVR